MTTRISTIYRAEVQIPNAVYEQHGHTLEYAMRSAQIAGHTNVASSGQDAYSDVYVWAEDSSRRCVEKWAAEWELYIRSLQS